MRDRILLLPCCLFLLLAACIAEDMAWSGHYNFPSGRWLPENKVTFSPDTSFVQDCSREAIISIRYEGKASVEDLPLVVETECLGSLSFSSDTICIKLLPGKQRTADKATVGVFETVDTLILPERPEPGWSITLYPLVDQKGVNGLYSLTLQLKK